MKDLKLTFLYSPRKQTRENLELNWFILQSQLVTMQNKVKYSPPRVIKFTVNHTTGPGN